MSKICYTPKRFGEKALDKITTANAILDEYAEQGLDVTLRQLYYQFVARGLIPNNMREYKNLGSLINDGRLAGLIDWDRLVDRTRELRSNAHWDAPSDIILACAKQFRLDLWEDQPTRVEVWIEKDALIGVIARACAELDIAYFSCRGYVSQSEIHDAAHSRIRSYERAGQEVLILHLGDHDPSGIDMSRDIQDRLHLFGRMCDVKRIALTMDQVDKYSPPPNPAKTTDSRATGYIDLYGDESWELDALEPAMLDKLIRDNVATVVDQDLMDAARERQDSHRRELLRVSDNWEQIAEYLDEHAPHEEDSNDTDDND